MRDETNIKLYPYVRKGKEVVEVKPSPFITRIVEDCPMYKLVKICHESCNWNIEGECKYKGDNNVKDGRLIKTKEPVP